MTCVISQKFQLFIDKCRALRSLQRVAVVLPPEDLLKAFDVWSIQHGSNSNVPDRAEKLISWIILPALRDLPPAFQEFCILGQWPFYWECKRNQDGSFSARFKDVTDGRATEVWPIGLLEEGWNSDNVKVQDYRTSYISGKLRIMRRVVEEHIETDELHWRLLQELDLQDTENGLEV